VSRIAGQERPTNQPQSRPEDDPLLSSILGDPGGEGGFESDEEGAAGQGGAAGTGFGEGDLAAAFGLGGEEDKPKPKERAEWQAVLRAVQADLPPTVGFIFRSWALRHRELVQGQPLSTVFSWWVLNMAHRDFLADQARPEDERQYDPQGLYVQDLLPMLQAEARAEREAIAEEARQGVLARLQPFIEQKLIPREVLDVLGATAGG